MKTRAIIKFALTGIFAVLFVAACSAQGSRSVPTKAATGGPGSGSAAAATTEKPIAPMATPSGDIPDSQQFVRYASSAGHYSLEVPEGWARTSAGATVRFDFHYDGLWVHLTHQSTPLDVASIRATQVKKLESAARAVQVKSVEALQIDGKKVIRVSYASNSEPNPVTNKQIRLENNTYYYYANGKLAELRLWAPLGADNVDQWIRISRSFTWK